MIYAVGLDWITASLAQREHFAVQEEAVSSFMQSIVERLNVRGCVLLQTCNRFELYLDSDMPINDVVIRQVLLQAIGSDVENMGSLFLCREEEAQRRLMQVASGLESQILGEEQIITQVRTAIELARVAKTTSPELETLFRIAVTAGKAVRTKIQFSTVPASSAHKAVEIAAQQLQGLNGKKVVVIGNGQMGRIAAGLLVEKGCEVTITLRSYRHGQTVVPPGCKTVSYTERLTAMEGCDLLISATRSPHYTVTKPMLQSLVKLPKVLLDIALPRDVDPDCQSLSLVQFYDMDDLRDGQAPKENPQKQQAEKLIDKYLADYQKWCQGRAQARLAHQTEKIAVFGGTSEGRLLCGHLARAGVKAEVFVATEYGSAAMPLLAGITVHAGRLDKEAMRHTLQGFTIVIDATHPYATEVSRNIVEAVQQARARYIRLVRPQVQVDGDILYVDNTAEAAQLLGDKEGAVLLTTGSKELAAYTQMPNYAKRLYPRVLPDAGVLQHCEKLGFSPSNIIAMQGPFTYEMNVALLHSIKAKWLVTKNTGNAGGIMQKLSAAQEVGAKVIMIARPPEPTEGHTLEEVCRMLIGFAPESAENTELRFPAFIRLNQKHCVVIGGGTVGVRRCKVLQQFGAEVTLISPKVKEQLSGAKIQKREFVAGDTKGAELVVAATNCRKTNRQIAEECKRSSILVSVADCPEESTFFFPAICKTQHLVAGLVSTGEHHTLVAQSAAAIREKIEELDS